MKKENKISIALKNVIHNKKYIIYEIFLVLCIILIIFSFSAFKTFNTILYDIENEFSNHLYFVVYDDYEQRSSDEVLDKIRKIDHVVAVYPKDYFEAFSYLKEIDDKKIDGSVILYGTTQDISPKIIYGRQLLNEGEIICPASFYPFDDLDVNNDINKNNVINSVKYLNKNLIFETNNKMMQFKLVGVYQNALITYDENQCYILFSDVIRVAEINEDSVVVYDDTDGSFNPPKLIIDDLNNVSFVEKELKEIGVYISPSYIPDKEFEMLVLIIIFSILFIALTTSFLLLVIMIDKIIKNDKTNLSLLKIFGFTSFDVEDIVYYEILIINLIAFIIGLVISLGIYFILEIIIYFKPYYFGKIIFSYSYISIPICLLFIVLISYFSTRIFKKELLNINIIDTLRG